jgi:hypothetical protein
MQGLGLCLSHVNKKRLSGDLISVRFSLNLFSPSYFYNYKHLIRSYKAWNRY